ncbi:bifunctional diguanylate cyclase/phosphodiesterase [Halalkalibacter urbisdiaboli]|uniref:bifunctional diguanylate cyclase/phosphodiesterase n=1 Tax=Halalkalibacter urbisdiaboli TaxID=1960589 RepID=UPI000B45371E|nr:GGDEF and EAL domain-containing protein [Halalkalibacter urbisdiaboli]
MTNQFERIFQTECILEKQTTGFWEIDRTLQFTFWSKEMYELFSNYSEKPPQLTEFLNTIQSEYADIVFKALRECIVHQRDFSIEYEIVSNAHRHRTVIQTGKAVLDKDGQVHRVIGTFQDVTSYRQFETRIKNVDTIISAITENLSAGIWAMDAQSGAILYLSNGVTDIFGYSLDEFRHDPLLWKKSIHPDDVMNVDYKREKLLRNGKLTHQYRIITKKNEVKWLHDQTLIVADENGSATHLIGIVADVSKPIESTMNIKYLSHHDSLTDLPNRRFFMKRLAEKMKNPAGEKRSFAMFYLDLDRFKYINDYLGHEMGDMVLVEMSIRLKRFIDSSCFLARLASDEFAIIHEGMTERNEVICFARKLIALIEEPIHFENQELSLTASIGICFYPDDGTSVQPLLKSADMALSRAKENGKNNFQIYSTAMNRKVTRYFASDKELRKALRNEEFFLEYQPKVDTKTGNIVGGEALIRWYHPEKGEIPPMSFIPLAEENGLIAGIGDWVFHKVCSDLKGWKEQGLEVVPISVNLSPKRLVVPGISQHIKSIVSHYDVNPSLLCVEITERSILLNEQQSQNVIRELKEFGIRFALDDFGTGYSSLTSLINYDIDILKIDKMFIAGMFEKNRNKQIIKYLLSLANSIDMLVVAEGVETQEQLDFLVQEGCPIIQGFLFSKPLKEPEFVQCLIQKTLPAIP